jgi:hypothetical protein
VGYPEDVRRIVIDALERAPDVVTGEGIVWLVHGHVKDTPEVRVVVKLKDGDDKWQGSNVVGQMMGGAHQEIEVNLQEKAVWINFEDANPTKPARPLRPRSV